MITRLFVIVGVVSILMSANGYAEGMANTVRMLGNTYHPASRGAVEGSYTLGYCRQESGAVVSFPNRLEYLTRETITNELFLSLGLTDRLSVNTHLPYEYTSVSMSNGNDLSENATGDISLGLSWELTGPEARFPTVILNASYSFDTGNSPYENDGDLPTGDGFPSLETTLTLHKPVEIFVPYVSFGYRYTFPVDDLSYASDPYHGEKGYWVTEVDPGDSFTFGSGLGIRYEDNLSFMIGYQFTMNFDWEYHYSAGNSTEEPVKDSRMIRIGAGFKPFPRCSIYPEFRAYRGDDDPDYEALVRVALY